MRTLLATVLAVAAVAPVVVTGPATGIGQSTATLTGSVDTEGEATTYHFEYGTTTAYGLTTPQQSAGDGSEPVDVQAALTGLTASTTYHYRLVATNASGTVEGSDRTLQTAANPNPPGISNQRARDIAVDSVQLAASVDPNGNATTYRFEYGTTTRYGTSTPEQSAGAGNTAVPITVNVGGLSAFTQYHYRLVATNAAGTTRGRDRTFTTARLPTGVTLTLSPSRVTWGRDLALGGRVSGTGAGRMPLALQAQRFPFDGGFQEIARTSTGNDGGYLFRVANLWATTRYRVVTRTRVVVTSPVAEARSAVLAGARVRHVSRRRARIEGSAFPALSGQARLQRRSLTGRWRTIKRRNANPADAIRTRYAFGIRRFNRSRFYRVVFRPADNGEHVSGTSRTVRIKRRPR
jgi:hypothetical protein